MGRENMTAVTLMKKQPKDQDRRIETASTYSWVLSQAEGRAPVLQIHVARLRAPAPLMSPQGDTDGSCPVLGSCLAVQGGCKDRASTWCCLLPAYPSLCGMHFLRMKHI